MAYWIDHALLWLLSLLSSLLLFLVLTGGRLILSLSLTFITILLLRIFLKRLPDKQLFCRRKRLRQIDSLLRKWALMSDQAALSEIRALAPELLTESEWKTVRLLQRMPGGEPLSDNRLLELCRSIPDDKTSVTILCTGPVAPSAAALLTSLDKPGIRLLDSRHLTRHLLKSTRLLPSEETKKERSRSFSACFAQLIQSIRPIRSVLYMLVFFAMYLFSHSRFYLFSSLLFLLQVIVCLICRLIAGRSAA